MSYQLFVCCLLTFFFLTPVRAQDSTQTKTEVYVLPYQVHKKMRYQDESMHLYINGIQLGGFNMDQVAHYTSYSEGKLAISIGYFDAYANKIITTIGDTVFLAFNVDYEKEVIGSRYWTRLQRIDKDSFQIFLAKQKEPFSSKDYDENDILLRKKDKNMGKATKFPSATAYLLNSKGYFITNHHVINKYSIIRIKGLNPQDKNRYYRLDTVITDKKNDLAILRLRDTSLILKDPSYALRESEAETGEELFTIGYPITDYMGYEAKLTTGVISSGSGFKGDTMMYQISSPIQPGNSGSPLFDKNANLIGTVCSQLRGGENVNYAIKLKAVRKLMEKGNITSYFTTENTLAGIPLNEKFKILKDNVHIVEVDYIDAVYERSIYDWDDDESEE